MLYKQKTQRSLFPLEYPSVENSKLERVINHVWRRNIGDNIPRSLYTYFILAFHPLGLKILS